MHQGMTKDRSRRLYRWKAMEPGIQRHMRDNDLSMRQLSSELGISYDSFLRYFSGEQSPSWKGIEVLEEYYRREIGELV